MKKCSSCGREYPDEATHCAVDGQPLTPMSPPGALPNDRKQGQAIASLVLGILSLACFTFLSGIPAIILGHIARKKARVDPNRFGGEGLALAGLILGYAGTALTIVQLAIISAMLLPALARAKARAQSINCINNMKQVGLAYRTWALDHEDQFQSNVSTNKGGTLELAIKGADGFDQNGVYQLQVLSNELASAKILVCPADNSKQVAASFAGLQPGNVSYQIRYGTNLSDANPQEILAVCPVHGHTLHCDGSVQNKTPDLTRNWVRRP